MKRALPAMAIRVGGAVNVTLLPIASVTVIAPLLGFAALEVTVLEAVLVSETDPGVEQAPTKSAAAAASVMNDRFT
jgi:hypothetical protein